MKNKNWKAEPSGNDVDWLVMEGDTSILITLEKGLSPQFQNYEKAKRIASLAAAAPEMLKALQNIYDECKNKECTIAITAQAAIKQATK